MRGTGGLRPYDYKDGLVYTDKSETGGNIYESKLLWALGNYSRFIRPGATLIMTDIKDNPPLKASAYKNENGELVVVVINDKPTKINLRINLQGDNNSRARIYETSETNNLKLLGTLELDESFEIAEQSITTIVI